MSKKARILIVDDEEPIRAFYAEELRDEGYDAIATDDAMQGLELIEKGEVDLVIVGADRIAAIALTPVSVSR